MNRKPVVSDLFYPGDPVLLKQEVSDFIKASHRSDLSPKALIAPHAGYIYSGPIAASAYTHLQNLKNEIKTVLLIGPSHRVHVDGLAASSAESFETPLGKVPVDQKVNARLMDKFNFVRYNDDAHQPEHCLEVQLPFLQTVLKDFEMVPLLFGDSSPEQISDVLETLWEDTATLIVISSDLSHYHDYQTARQIDENTTKAIEAYDSETINGEMACGHTAIRGCLQSVERHRLQVHTVDLRNSGDTQGNKNRVVGYGAYLFT